jgi:hypothetical protein
MTYEDRYHSFAQYLKGRQIELGFVPPEIINDIDDEDIMESYRRDHDSGKEFYSKEQERGIIMEYSSNEAISQAFEEVKHSNHLDTVEENLLKEFSGRIKPISVLNMNPAKLASVLNDFKVLGVNLEPQDIDKALEEACSIFALWILEGFKYYIKEEDEDRTFSIDFDKMCAACLLNETLHNYRTLFGWSLYAKTDEIEERELKNYNSVIISEIIDHLYDAVLDKVDEELPQKKFQKVMSRLFDLVFEYLFNLPLISCWMHGKDLAQKRYAENCETHKFLSYTHDYFCDKYKCIESGVEAQFFKDFENYLNTLELEQLEILFDAGFPIHMSSKQARKAKRILERLIRSATAMKKSAELKG